MATNVDDIRKRRPLAPEGRERVQKIKRAMRLEVALAELRDRRGVSQTAVAAALETSRPNLARIEKVLDSGSRRSSAMSRRSAAGWRPTRSSTTAASS